MIIDVDRLPGWANCLRCGLIWTHEPDDVCRTCKILRTPAYMTHARGRAHAMLRLGLPRPWARKTRAAMFWRELHRQVHGRVEQSRQT